MFSTPLICSSIGVTTVWDTTSELAPGYWPVTLTVGGAMSGYCATGRRQNATPPTITNTMETTAAKIGRSMKKREMRMFLREAVYSALETGVRGGGAYCGFTLVQGRSVVRPLSPHRSSGSSTTW